MGLLGFVRDAQKTGFGGAISKEAKRLGVMPSGSSMKMLGTLKDTVQGVNSALGPMGSSKLSAGFDAADKVGNTLQRADSVATGVVRGDVGSMVTAAHTLQGGSSAYKNASRRRK